MSNFDKTSKVLKNLDVKVDKLDGYLYVNSQGEIEVRDSQASNMINIWSGQSLSALNIDISSYIPKISHNSSSYDIKLLIYGYYENTNMHGNGYIAQSIYNGDLLDGHQNYAVRGLPTFFKSDIVEYDYTSSGRAYPRNIKFSPNNNFDNFFLNRCMNLVMIKLDI